MASTPKNTYADSVPAVEQACRILIYLARHHSTPMKLTTICTEVGIHNSKGYSILNTLGSFGLVQRDPIAKTYHLGPGLAHLGRMALESMDIARG